MSGETFSFDNVFFTVYFFVVWEKLKYSFRGSQFVYFSNLIFHDSNCFQNCFPLNLSETIVLSEPYRLWEVKGGHPRFPHYAKRRQSLGQQMLDRWAKIGCENATVGKNGLSVYDTKARSAARFRNHVDMLSKPCLYQLNFASVITEPFPS